MRLGRNPLTGSNPVPSAMIKLKPVRQTAGFCGPSSLRMVLAYYGIVKSERELAKLSGATRAKGTRAKGLLRAIKKLGFNGKIKDFSSISDIKKYVNKNMPVIVNWFSHDNGHYSVVTGFKDKNIFLMDPEIGKTRKLEIDVFTRVWFDFPGDFLKSKNDVIIRRMIVISK